VDARGLALVEARLDVDAGGGELAEDYVVEFVVVVAVHVDND